MIGGSAKRPISFFIPGLNGGGAQKVVVNLANAIVDLTDHPVHIVLARAEGPFLEQVRPEVDIVDLGTRRASRSIRQLALYLRRARPAVLCSSLNYANVCAAIAWELAGRPCRLVVREDNVVRMAEGGPGSRLRRRFLHSLMRAVYSRSNCVVAISESVRASLVDHRICAGDVIRVIGNPINVEPEETGVPARSLGLASDGTRYICAVGRLAHQKGFDVLIDAFALLQDHELELVILGEGPLRGDLERKSRDLGIAERVHLPGFFESPHGVVKGAELFVLSSRWEGFGLVLVEALALGVPIVASDCPGAPREILLDGHLGHLIPAEDSAELAQAIEAALESPRASVEQRVSRAQEFSAPVIAQEYLNEAFALGGVAP